MPGMRQKTALPLQIANGGRIRQEPFGISGCATPMHPQVIRHPLTPGGIIIMMTTGMMAGANAAEDIMIMSGNGTAGTGPTAANPAHGQNENGRGTIKRA